MLLMCLMLIGGEYHSEVVKSNSPNSESRNLRLLAMSRFGGRAVSGFEKHNSSGNVVAIALQDRISMCRHHVAHDHTVDTNMISQYHGAPSQPHRL